MLACCRWPGPVAPSASCTLGWSTNCRPGGSWRPCIFSGSYLKFIRPLIATNCDVTCFPVGPRFTYPSKRKISNCEHIAVHTPHELDLLWCPCALLNVVSLDHRISLNLLNQTYSSDPPSSQHSLCPVLMRPNCTFLLAKEGRFLCGLEALILMGMPVDQIKWEPFSDRATKLHLMCANVTTTKNQELKVGINFSNFAL